MGRLFVLIVLAVGGYFAYRWYVEPTPSEENLAESLTEAAASIPEPGALPPALSELRQRADALWDAASAKGDPTRAAEAPVVARTYSDVLRGLYNVTDSSVAQSELIEQRLAPLATQLFFSKTRYGADPSGFFQDYTIAPGQVLDDIGRNFGLSYQFLNMLRGADPESGTYAQGAVIKVAKVKEFGGYELRISRSAFHLDLFIGGIFARRYPVGLGKEGQETPLGTTYIDQRERGQNGVQWTNPETGEVLQAGQEGNILGNIWLRFHDSIGRSGLGIHGYTGADVGLGRKVSNGCVRLRNEDALELYHLTVPCLYAKDGNFISRAPMKVQIVD